MRQCICRIFLYLGAVALCGCSVLNLIPTPTLQALTIQDVIVHRPLSANAQTHDWGLPVYDPSQIGLGLVKPEDANTNPDDLPQNDELSLAEGEYLSLYLVLSSPAEQATFLVTALVDYHQTPFTMDGQLGLLHEVDVGLGGDLYVPIQIEINGPGAHDLTFIAFKNPYDRPMDRDLRWTPMFIGYRTVVIVGNDNRPVAVAQPDATGNPPPAGVDWGPDILFAKPGNVHPSHPNGQLNLASHGKPNQVFAYRVWMSNLSWTEPKPLTYGLVRFLNYHQIEFKGKDLFVVHLDENQEVLLDDSLTLPAQAGINEVQIVYVYDPYKSLLHNEVSPFRYVYGSPCLGIKVP